jgi:hypothetical protein
MNTPVVIDPEAVDDLIERKAEAWKRRLGVDDGIMAFILFRIATAYLFKSLCNNGHKPRKEAIK